MKRGEVIELVVRIRLKRNFIHASKRQMTTGLSSLVRRRLNDTDDFPDKQDWDKNYRCSEVVSYTRVKK